MTVYLMCGLAFSGKSTVASAIRKHLGAVVISLDEINAARGLQGGTGIPSEEWARTHQEALARLEADLESGRDVVIDDTNCFRFLRDEYGVVARRHGAETRIIYVEASPALVRRRMEANEQASSRPPVTEPVLQDLIRKFEAPGPDEPVLVIPPASDVEAWVLRHLSRPG